MKFVQEVVRQNAFDLVILDNFSTLGEVEDENAASSFNAIQQFLLQLKVQGVATMLIHHAGKSGEDFRGSSKLAATFETIVKLSASGPLWNTAPPPFECAGTRSEPVDQNEKSERWPRGS
jgi:hypothetical protein